MFSSHRARIPNLLNVFVFFCFLGTSSVQAAEDAAGGSDKPWVTLQNQVLTLRTRRAQLLQNMAAIKSEKTKNKENSVQVKEKMEELTKLYKEYREVTEEYNKLLVVLKYRFPERLAKDEEREYKPIEIESLEKLEEELNIDSRLTRVYRKAQSQYQTPEQRRPAAETVPLGEGGPTPERSTIREQDPLLISK